MKQASIRLNTKRDEQNASSSGNIQYRPVKFNFVRVNKRIFLLVLLMVTAVFKLYPQVWAEITHFADTEGEGLGSALAIDGNYAVVGAPYYNSHQGCVYVMRYNSNDTTWQKIARLTASDGTHYEEFGSSVAISGDYIIVGTPLDDDDGERSGSAYVFTKPAVEWTDMTETAKLKPFDGDALNNFGKRVAIYGEKVLVGAPGERQSVDYPGYAYLFERPGTGWEDVSGGTKLEDPNGTAGDYFGSAVAISDEALVISATRTDSKGAAYVFTKQGDEWVYSARLNPTHNQTIPALAFGADIDIEGNVIVAGAPGAGMLRGRVFVFEKPAGGWNNMTQTALLYASDQADYDFFGSSLSIYNDTILIGSNRKNEEKAVYLFNKPASGWVSSSETVKIAPPDANEYFGLDVDMYGDNLLIGSEVHFYKFLTFNPVQVTSHPVDSSRVCPGSQLELSISSTNTRSYQWQISTDNGTSFTDVSDNDLYDSATTNTLVVIVNQYMEGFQYRCIASNPQYSDTSNVGVLLLDNTPPEIISEPVNKILYAGSSCQAILPYYIDNVAASDNCAVDTIMQTPQAGTVISGPVNLITLTIADEMGNETAVDFNVTVIDSIKPVIHGTAEALNLQANEDCIGILPDYGAIFEVADNCDDTLDVVQSPIIGTEVTDSAMVTLTFIDDAGNFMDTSFWVFVVDTLPPVILSSHEDVILPGGDGCTAELPDYTGDVLARENCSASAGVIQDPVPGTIVSGAFNTITLKVSDEYGNITEVSFKASVEDTIAPSITCADGGTIDLEEGETIYIVPDKRFDPLTVEDNCGFTMISNDFHTGLTLKNAEIPAGTHVITWTAQDGAGNKGACTTIITVNAYETSLQELKSEMLIYPNPTKGIINCRFDEGSEKNIIITNLAGQILLEEIVHGGDKTINISSFQPGMYLLHVEDSKGKSIRIKIIKQ